MSRCDAYRITSELVNPEPSHDQNHRESASEPAGTASRGSNPFVGPVVFANQARCGTQPQGPRGDERVNTTKFGPVRDLAAKIIDATRPQRLWNDRTAWSDEQRRDHRARREAALRLVRRRR